MRQMNVTEMVEAGLLAYAYDADKGNLVPTEGDYVEFYPNDVYLEVKHPDDNIWEQVARMGIEDTEDGLGMFYMIAGSADDATYDLDTRLDVKVYRLEAE